MKVLGIESTCDETGIAIVNDSKEILSNVLISQIDIHKEFGGVVPEVASRNHLDIIDKLVFKAFKEANLEFNNIDAVATACGPGLIGGVIVGTMVGKTIASVLKKPFIAVNHLEAHALTSRLSNNLEFPFLLFLLSGGHCQILIAEGVGKYQELGSTIDDSLGEAFDKVAQLLGLEYPGGPKIEQIAKNGNEKRFKFPMPLITNKTEEERESLKFSFSGLKTAVRREIEKITGENYNFETSAKKLTEQDKADIAASFQYTVTNIIENRFENTVKLLEKKDFWKDKKKVMVIAGGVSANQYIKEKMTNICNKYNYDLITPPLKFCTDNGVMIAWAGLERFRLGMVNDITFAPRARWSLLEE